MIDPRLTDKHVLITGANHGIGAATALALAAQGAAVFITYYREKSIFSKEQLDRVLAANEGGRALYEARQQTGVDRLIDQIVSWGGKAAALELDLADPGNIAILFDACEQSIGPVDILINNHTYCKMTTFDPALVKETGFPVQLPSAGSIDAHFVINARGVALMMEEYLQRYLARKASWGRIINLSSDEASADSYNISYSASKHAIESFSRSAAASLGKYGITVNIVAPGPIQTGYITPDQEITIAQGTPLGRVGQPEDIADLIVFLASEQAHWLTGQLIYVGGGWRMSL
jgi:3-oxoacyl-[acyl-carrier protein] reductase